jgi:hypothetical protein
VVTGGGGSLHFICQHQGTFILTLGDKPKGGSLCQGPRAWEGCKRNRMRWVHGNHGNPRGFPLPPCEPARHAGRFWANSGRILGECLRLWRRAQDPTLQSWTARVGGRDGRCCSLILPMHLPSRCRGVQETPSINYVTPSSRFPRK